MKKRATRREGVTLKSRLHPLAKLLPNLPAEEFERLVASIKEHGILNPVLVFQGQVIDGRHRLRAAERLGIPWEKIPRTEWVGSEQDLLRVSLTTNLDRRQVTPTQKAVLGLELIPLMTAQAKERQRAGGKRAHETTAGTDRRKSQRPSRQKQAEVRAPQAGPTRAPQTRDLVGAAVGVKGRMVQDALTIQKNAPELLPLMKSGALEMAPAKRIAALPEKARTSFLKKAEREGVAAALTSTPGTKSPDSKHTQLPAPGSAPKDLAEAVSQCFALAKALSEAIDPLIKKARHLAPQKRMSELRFLRTTVYAAYTKIEGACS